MDAKSAFACVIGVLAAVRAFALDVKLSPSGDIRFGNGSWEALPSTKGWGSDGNASPDPSETSIKTVLTKDDLDQLVNKGGLVICGAGIFVKKVVLQ